ncbi:MAG: hypothetical protein D6813_09300 [Calditrichaeota bacterium]|nr:MAG: hypothetical protein D6813_09300 [Calditrichota bacterium]
MCRLLLVKSKEEFEIATHLTAFAEIAKNSKEYQGHGWGCGFLRNEKWYLYKNLTPIWEDNLMRFGTTRLLIVHARSAFKNQGITVENNMPFFDGHYMFIFNGELQGVKLKETGRTGAEKIYRFIKRFERGNLIQALEKALGIIHRRTNYIKAMNIIMADKTRVYVTSCFSEDPEYFTLRFKQTNNLLIICSEMYPGETNWLEIKNNSIEVF